MPTLAEQIRRRAHVYVAHGGKTNRRQQAARLVLMAMNRDANFSVRIQCGAKTETNRWGRLGTNGDNSETLENKKADFRRLFCFCWP